MPYSFRTDRIVSYEDWSEWTDRGFGYRQFLKFWLKQPLPDATFTKSELAVAYISEGRWVADCPMGCGGAIIVTPSDPVFLCMECGSGWHTVVFPSVSRRRLIEKALLKRPLSGLIPKSRNWLPGETVGQLNDQNRENGIS